MSIDKYIAELTTREIPLIGDKVVIVDIDEYKWVSMFKWKPYCNGSNWYAKAHMPTIGRDASMHRIIAGALPGQLVDHRNGNGLDNRKCNLRIATHSQNMMNRPGTGKSSKFKGVCWDKQSKCWVAAIRRDGKVTRLGKFGIEEDAAAAYNAAALEIHGEFAWINPLGATLNETPKRHGRPSKPYYSKRRDRWCTIFDGRYYTLAAGQENEADALARFAEILKAWRLKRLAQWPRVQE